MTAYEQGRAAARKWIEAADYTRPQPQNPHALTREQRIGRDPIPFEHRAWGAGYDHEIYAEFGDPSRDMERAERAFGC